MKILFNTMGLGKGGAERVINILSNNLVNNNEVIIITNYHSEVNYDFDSRINIISLVNHNCFRKLRRISPFILLKMKKYIELFTPDVIISFLPEPSFKVLFLKKYFKSIKKIPIIVSVRNDPTIEYSNFVYNFLMKKLYPLSNKLVLQTEDAKKYFMKNLNINGIVIPNPVNDNFLIDRYNGNRDKRIVAVGRLEPQKNYYNMIDAFKIVSQTNNDYIFEIYGEGNLRGKLQKYIDSIGLSDIIFLKGQIDDIQNRIYKASAFVMSSDYEGMPNSLLEAACLGVPCVSTDCPCGGPREILLNGNAGCLVPVNNSIELAQGIFKIIGNKEFQNLISLNASKNSDKYKTINIISQWNSLIIDIMKG